VKNLMFNDTISFFYYILLFAIYCFMGWTLEVIYRSIAQRKFVNAGFLFGPFIPIYGLGAFIIIVMQHFFQDGHLVARFIVFGLAITLMEYLTGFLSEKIFKMKLWDYSENKFNLHGHVCLHFSIIWALLALVFLRFVHPAVFQRVVLLDEEVAKITGDSLHVSILG